MNQETLIRDIDDLPFLMSVSDLARVTNVGRSKAYELCYMPGFPVVRLGKSLCIPRDAFVRWLDKAGAQ